MPDEQNVASSATPESPAPLPVLSDLTSDQRAQWKLTGEVVPVTPPAESSPATPVDQVVSTEASPAPASEPGSPSTGKKKNAETRKQELEAEIQSLLHKRAQLRSEVDTPRPSAAPDVPAASSPATQPLSDFPSYETWITTPAASASADPYADFIEARTLHRLDLRDRQHRDQQARQQAEQEAHEVLHGYRERAERFMAEHPDYWTIVEPLTTVTRSATTDAVGALIQRSDVGPQVALHLGTHLEDYQRLIRLPVTQAVYELGKLEAALTPSSPSAVVPLVKTTAPPPPPTLSTRAIAPVDDVEAALASGDFRRYRAAQNARDLAAHR